MKPLSEATLNQVAIIEGYLWECVQVEIANRNGPAAARFISILGELTAFTQDGREDITPPVEMPHIMVRPYP